ncbi:MAG: LexA family transcriptional regulator [Eubacteriales bacterium]|nr:LexA family transcriptional regulator [Eubacteriales bacterium]
MELNEKIKMLRAKRGLTLEELGNRVGVGKSTVRKWENGDIANMRRDKIAKLASALDTTPAYLMGWEEPSEPDYLSIPGIEPLPETRKLPILGAIACGSPILAEENIEDYAEVPKYIKADFCLRCVGDSMIGARIFDGDLVYIKQGSDFHDGDICAVRVNCDDATLKRVYRISDNLLELRPENPTFRIQRYTGEQLADITIVGKAVAFTSMVRH